MSNFKEIESKILIIKENLAYWQDQFNVAQKELDEKKYFIKKDEFHKELNSNNFNKVFLYEDLDLKFKKDYLDNLIKKTSYELFIVGENKETNQIVFGLSLEKDKKERQKDLTFELINIIRGTIPSTINEKFGKAKNFIILDNELYGKSSYFLAIKGMNSYIIENNGEKVIYKGSLSESLVFIRKKLYRRFK